VLLTNICIYSQRHMQHMEYFTYCPTAWKHQFRWSDNDWLESVTVPLTRDFWNKEPFSNWNIHQDWTFWL